MAQSPFRPASRAPGCILGAACWRLWIDQTTTPWGYLSQVDTPLAEFYEVSPMGGGFWLQNSDGTFTDYSVFLAVPQGYGFLDLYAMGLMRPEEVPDFFSLENMQPIFVDGQWAVSADKKVISIDQVIAAMGPRLPPASDSQKSGSSQKCMQLDRG